MQRIIPYIDGINSVQKIAILADTDLTLTRRALAHLLYYGCILMLNTFHFNAIYATTAEIGVFVEDTKMQDECRRYIVTPHSPFKNSVAGSSSAAATNTSQGLSSSFTPSTSFLNNRNHKSSNLNPSSSGQAPQPPSRATVLHLYASLRQGLSLRDWCLTHASSLAYIDVRRLITFGVIKGFLYRSHRYAIALRAADTAADAAVAEEALRSRREAEKTWRKAAMSSGWRTPVALQDNEPALDGGFGGVVVRAKKEVDVEKDVDGVEGKQEDTEADGKMPGVEELGKGRSLADQLLARYLDGCHCLDEVCTDTGMGQQEAVRKLRGLGDVVFVNR